MTTFAEFTNRGDDVGYNYLVDVSLDGFSTRLYRWCLVNTQSVAPAPPSVELSSRIVDMSVLSREFPADRGITAASITLTLENLDGGVSWLLGWTTDAENINNARFLLTIEAYSLKNPTDNALKTLGIFSALNPAKRGDGVVVIDLVDDTLGKAGALAETPSVRDWCGITDSNRPPWLTDAMLNGGAVTMHPTTGLESVVLADGFDPDAPTPLLFGPNWHGIHRVAGDVYVVCAVAGSAGALPMGVAYLKAGNDQTLPDTLQAPSGVPGATVPLWQVRRTPDIVKNGKTWHLLWVTVDLSGFADQSRSAADVSIYKVNLEASLRGLSVDIDTKGPASGSAFAYHDAVAPLSVQGFLFSHPTNDLTATSPIHPVTILQDLVTYYSQQPPSIDTSSFDRVRAVRPGLTASGSITAGNTTAADAGGAEYKELVDGDLVRAIRGLCNVAGCDVFLSWNATMTASVFVADLATYSVTFTTLDETLFESISDRVDEVGGRWQPFNRSYVRIGGKRYGPVDDRAGISKLGRIVVREFDGEWAYIGGTSLAAGLFQLRNQFLALGDGETMRPIVTVRTWLHALNLELGDYVILTWTNESGGTNYSGSVFRVEAIRLDPLAARVELELVWATDLFLLSSPQPYLLDDETISTRATGNVGRTVTLTTGSTTVTFSSGSLVTNGVAVGDQLIITDANEAADSWQRNRVLDITGSITATTCVVDASDFGSGGPFALSTWEIRRSVLTYRANATLYGKTSQSNGQFSNATAANKLLDG